MKQWNQLTILKIKFKTKQMAIELKTATMKQTEREYEAMANAILATFEYTNDKCINEFVKPAYFVKFNEAKDRAKFECHYTDEDGKDDTHHFTLLKSDSITKLISYVEDNYNSLVQVEPNF